MPCRSDYMEPSERERNQANKVVTNLNSIADAVTFANDVLREFLLGESSRRPLPFINRAEQWLSELKRLRDQDKNLYSLARPARLDGLFNHVDELLAEYVDLNGFVTRTKVMRFTDLETIRKRQNEHREADLSRLMKVFADTGDRQRLRLVLDADNTKPLEPQLGFSPDDF